MLFNITTFIFRLLSVENVGWPERPADLRLLFLTRFRENLHSK